MLKQTMVAALAATMTLSPLASAAVAAPRGDQDRGSRDYDRREARDDRHRSDRHDDRKADRREAREDRREDRREARRDSRRHNGFWSGGKFHRGQPSRADRRARDFGYGYNQYRQGERLNAYERRNYRRVSDYRRYRLSAPPRGYEWRRSNTGEYILAGIATGVILSAILNSNR